LLNARIRESGCRVRARALEDGLAIDIAGGAQLAINRQGTRKRATVLLFPLAIVTDPADPFYISDSPAL
jgi:hypothetical protein